MSRRKLFLGGFVLVCVSLCVFFAGGGTLEPPAGPGPTMHTLDELYEISAGLSQPKRYVTRASGAIPGTFVRFGDIDGECKDIDHTGWCDIVTFHQGQKLPITGAGAGRQVGPVGFDDVSVIKVVDKASPKLAEAVCKATVLPTVDIDVTVTTESGRVSYLRYILHNVLVSSYNIVGRGEGGRPMEEVTLNFEEITMVYLLRDTAGQLLGEVEYTWPERTGGD
ncbi:MAG TPA: type VI secretion system tube protein Hcp [Anaerohalosphaeraceae bacterium]|jgi:type VI secretion system secreted protein Hcp|nr:type VI secretion system tube protein Hcp [Anaerohalosphaeraceae bacterium]HRT48917.1 type VI secretion system tube protein Hcp [Anaerohalosphaeraceae bacterium]HRT85040.1 type VI secretion system tube protein Hcp [Anaerohalosphaeraceae bacterium]